MDENQDDSAPDLTPSIRFWSDYSRVFYHPRGLHRVPDPAEWEREVGWIQGIERFNSYDAVQPSVVCICESPRRLTTGAYLQNHAVLEDSFRLFAEECDLLQVCFSQRAAHARHSDAWHVA